MAGCYQDAPVSAPEATMERLITLLGDGDVKIRLTAAEALGKIGNGQAGRFLLPVLHDPDPRVREMAARSVGVLSVAGKEAEAGLIALLEDPNDGVRHAAAQALGGREETPELTGALARLLLDSDPSVRRAASHVFFLAQGRGPVQVLSESATDNDPTVRQWAIAALAETGDDRAMSVILERLRHDPDVSVRAEAAYRLQYVGDRSVTKEMELIAEGESSLDVKRWMGESQRNSGGISAPVQRVDQLH